MDLGVIAKKHSPLTRVPELELYHKTQFSIIPRSPIFFFFLGGSYSSAGGAGGYSQYILNCIDRMVVFSRNEIR